MPNPVTGASGERIHVAYCIGTRPEAIRSSRLLRLMAKDTELRLTLISSGQHYDHNMLKSFLDELHVPRLSVDLQVGSADGARQTASIMSDTGRILLNERPDVVCVFGDTNSTLGSALAAAKLSLPLVHIESGCRSYDMTMPEEVNRRLVDQAAGLLLAVSELGRQNLLQERVLGHVEVVGDPLFDVFLREQPPTPKGSNESGGLVTLHRPENVDDPHRVEFILSKLAEASKVTGIRWIFPVHPRTRRSLGGRSYQGIRFVDSLPYRRLLASLFSSRICVTDSGGLQKEAFWARVPCVTIRPTTEWMETVWQRANTLAPPESDITAVVMGALAGNNTPDYTNPYGDGNASEKILAITKDWLVAGASFTPPHLSVPP